MPPPLRRPHCPALPSPGALQLGLWTSLFVLCTLLINAPTIPAVLRFTGLAEASCSRPLPPGSRGGTTPQNRRPPDSNSLHSTPLRSAPRPPMPMQVSPVKLGIREKAKRALLRHTAAAIKARAVPPLCRRRAPAVWCEPASHLAL